MFSYGGFSLRDVWHWYLLIHLSYYYDGIHCLLSLGDGLLGIFPWDWEWYYFDLLGYERLASMLFTCYICLFGPWD